MLVAQHGLGQLAATKQEHLQRGARSYSMAVTVYDLGPTGCIDDDIWRALHPDDRKSADIRLRDAEMM